MDVKPDIYVIIIFQHINIYLYIYILLFVCKSHTIFKKYKLLLLISMVLNFFALYSVIIFSHVFI